MPSLVGSEMCIRDSPCPYDTERNAKMEHPSLLPMYKHEKTCFEILSVASFPRPAFLCRHASDSSGTKRPVLCLRKARRPRARGIGTPFELVRRLVDTGDKLALDECCAIRWTEMQGPLEQQYDYLRVLTFPSTVLCDSFETSVAREPPFCDRATSASA